MAHELKRRDLDRYLYAPPGGESMADVALRVDRFIHLLHRWASMRFFAPNHRHPHTCTHTPSISTDRLTSNHTTLLTLVNGRLGRETATHAVALPPPQLKNRETANKRVMVVCHGEVMWAMRTRLERMRWVHVFITGDVCVYERVCGRKGRDLCIRSREAMS